MQKIDALHNSIDILEANQRMTHNFRHPWSKAPSIGSEFPKQIASPLKDLQNLNFMGDVPNHQHSDAHVSPLSPLPETNDKFATLIPEFQPIVVKSPESTQFLPLINLDLNRTSNTQKFVVQNPNLSPPNNCVVEEIFQNQLRLNH